MKKSILLSKFQGCLCGVAIGDARGMPYEMMTPNEIFFATGGQGVTDFNDGIQNRISGTAKLKRGSTTDDWQLCRANSRAIIKCEGLDYLAIAQEHVVEFDRSTLGWGKSTGAACAAIKNHFESTPRLSNQQLEGEILTRAINQATTETPGTGNGVGMKIPPVALFHFGLKTSYLLDNVIVLGQMTHRDPRASYAACAIALIIKMVLEDSQQLVLSRSLSSNYDFINELVKLEIDRSCNRDLKQFPGDSFVGRLINLLATGSWLQDTDSLGRSMSLIKQTGTSCFALESIPFAIGVFLRNPVNFVKGITEAVNSGGDTDTNASMVGAMIGANVGLDGIPEDWIKAVPSCQEALELAEKLFELVWRKTTSPPPLNQTWKVSW
ncbi:MAG: ADP-ribosylglycohydrolase family protein [Candidatus Buchananbacteria bacterium]|nr:ADP-ribosylglycohydrolase family protein [Candidatus Buchananbacteria bacterium]